jgi:hypothetical protein
MDELATVSAAKNWARKNSPFRIRRFLMTGGMTEN